jgi:hypothetical protein
MKKTKPAIITGVSPSNWKPAGPEDFIGVAREVAGILAIKAGKLLSSGSALRLLLYGPPGTGKTAIAAWLSFGDWDRTDTLHDKKWCAEAPQGRSLNRLTLRE